MSNASTPVRISGVAIIVVCFFASAALRITESGPALAEGISALSSEDGKTVQDESTALPDEDANVLLTAIREREQQLQRENSTLADRSQALSVAETKLAEQLAAFQKAQENLEKTLALADKAAERDIERMTTVYESMKPNDAARIFERMEVKFAAGLLSRMRPEVTAEVLTSMEPDTAYAVTLTIASQNVGVPTQ